MKSTILNLNKRVLVVEKPADCIRFEIVNNVDNSESIMIKFFTDENVYQPFLIEEKGVLKLICGGSELSEEIAKGLVNSLPHPMGSSRVFRNYLLEHKFPVDAYLFNSALYSFISAIEANNYYCENNPIEKPHNFGLLHTYPTGNPLMDESFKDAIEWQEAESRIFNPDRTLIFEIL